MIRLLFICMGNICRSPAAEAVMKAKVKKAGLDDKIHCDSAGTISYHAGEPADSRMRTHAKERGIIITSISRGFNPSVDFEKYDYIITMDNDNYRNINDMDKDGTNTSKVLPMTDFCSKMDVDEVPDPYYGGAKGFETVLDILDDACEGFLEHVRNEEGL